METSSLMGDSASQLTHNLALTARASPDADQRKRQGDRDHGRDHGRGQNICGGQNEMEIQGTALAYWSTVKAKQTNKQTKNAKKPRSPRNTTHYHTLDLHEEWGTIGIKYLCNWAAYFAFFLYVSTSMMCSAFRKTQKRVVQFSSVA